MMSCVFSWPGVPQVVIGVSVGVRGEGRKGSSFSVYAAYLLTKAMLYPYACNPIQAAPPLNQQPSTNLPFKFRKHGT